VIGKLLPLTAEHPVEHFTFFGVFEDGGALFLVHVHVLLVVVRDLAPVGLWRVVVYHVVVLVPDVVKAVENGNRVDVLVGGVLRVHPRMPQIAVIIKDICVREKRTRYKCTPPSREMVRYEETRRASAHAQIGYCGGGLCHIKIEREHTGKQRVWMGEREREQTELKQGSLPNTTKEDHALEVREQPVHQAEGRVQVVEQRRQAIVDGHALEHLSGETPLPALHEQNQRSDTSPVGSETRQVDEEGAELCSVQIQVGVHIFEVVVPAMVDLVVGDTIRVRHLAVELAHPELDHVVEHTPRSMEQTMMIVSLL
jgi:hypothetical protein